MIGTCPIKKWKLTHGFLKIDKKNKLPIFIAKWVEEGKTCFVSWGMHGDEINGPRLVQMLMHSIDPKKLKGTIIFAPVLNVSGFHHKQRYVFEDNKDLNRCFFGRGKTMAYKIAHAVYENIMKKSDLGIDCHDAGESTVLLPQPRVHVNEKKVCTDGCTVNMGKLLWTKIILQRKGEPGMMAVESFKRLKRPVLTVEVGGGMMLWDEFLDTALQWVKNILMYSGMLDGKISSVKEQFVINDVDRFWYQAKHEGLLYTHAYLWQEVHKWDLIAEIYDPLTDTLKPVLAKHCGFVFSVKAQEKVDVWEHMLSILQHKECRKHGTKVSKYTKKI